MRQLILRRDKSKAEKRGGAGPVTVTTYGWATVIVLPRWLQRQGLGEEEFRVFAILAYGATGIATYLMLVVRMLAILSARCEVR
jgi:hypothetical protein